MRKIYLQVVSALSALTLTLLAATVSATAPPIEPPPGAPVAPEPVSSILFGIGGAILFLVYRFKK
ncbi:MAG: PEP-CTERM sorting domain-containing protein [Nitrospirae bacterium]|nr:PEP-CTERM sorting domain-containing protein [Nitrospirota bacterium]